RSSTLATLPALSPQATIRGSFSLQSNSISEAVRPRPFHSGCSEALHLTRSRVAASQAALVSAEFRTAAVKSTWPARSLVTHSEACPHEREVANPDFGPIMNEGGIHVCQCE